MKREKIVAPIIIFLLMFCCFTSSLFAQNKKMGLIGDAKKGAATLRWTVEEWPENLIGFNVKRRIRTSKDMKRQEWKKLNLSVIRPELSADKNWALLEENRKEQERLIKKTKDLIERGRLQLLSKEVYLTKLYKMSQGELLELANNIRNSPDYALIHGFAYVDRRFEKTGEYEYGLFPVYSEGDDPNPISVFICRLVSTQVEWLKLLGTVQDGCVKLKWTIEDYWPENIAGIFIKRRQAADEENRDGKWRPVSSKPIYPELNEKRDLSDLGLDQNEQIILRKKMKDLFNRQRLKPLSRKEFLAKIFNASIEELKGFNLAFYKDYDYALFSGFGYYDHRFSSSDVYEYGLFPVDNNGKISPKPVSTFIIREYDNDDPGFSVQLNVEKAKIGTFLRWSYPVKEFHERALFGYNVYRSELKPEDKLKFEKLNITPISTINKKDDHWLWHFIDKKADNAKRYVYAIVPVDHFQKEYKKTIYRYYSEPNIFDLYRLMGDVRIESVSQKTDNAVEIKWSFGSKEEKYIQGFIVERTRLPERELAAISTLLSPNTRNFMDMEDKKEGEVYMYRVSVMHNNNAIKRSVPVSLYYVNLVKLPPPSGLMAHYIDEEDGGYVYLAWEKFKGESLDLNSGYVIFTDLVEQGTMIREASIPLITDEQYTYRLGAYGGREFTFGVAGKSKFGIIGEIATVSHNIPIKQIPRVVKVKYKELNEGKQIKLQWDYKDINDLKGFEIYQNGELATTSISLGRYDREWISEELEPNRLYKFEVVARSYSGELSKYNKKVEYFYIL